MVKIKAPSKNLVTIHLVTIDHELIFDNHVNNLCKKASLKLNTLARIASFMNLSKK